MAKRTTKASSRSSAATALGKIGKKGSASSRSATPQLSVTDEGQLEAIADIIDAKNVAKEADSALKIAEAAFRDEATELFEAHCRDHGALQTSVRFMGTLELDEGET
ncbi:hypothetical protein LCGC14_2769450, partial [marine sediment metagenome]